MYVKDPYTGEPYTKQVLRAMLPQVGDHLKKKPEFGQSPGATHFKRALPCVVTYVHPAHLWYQVEFKTRSGETFRQCYKLPDATYDQNRNARSKYLEADFYGKK